MMKERRKQNMGRRNFLEMKDDLRQRERAMVFYKGKTFGDK